MLFLHTGKGAAQVDCDTVHIGISKEAIVCPLDIPKASLQVSFLSLPCLEDSVCSRDDQVSSERDRSPSGPPTRWYHGECQSGSTSHVLRTVYQQDWIGYYQYIVNHHELSRTRVQTHENHSRLLHSKERLDGGEDQEFDIIVITR